MSAGREKEKKKNKFIAQSASESSDNEISENENEKKLITKKEEKKVFDSSEEDEEDEEEMTKEDLEFLKEDPEGSEGSESGSNDSGSEVSSPDELSEDDLELIEENLGKRRAISATATSKSTSKKGGDGFKRLRRRNEIESSSEGEEASDNEEGNGNASFKTQTTKSSRQLQNLFDEEEDDDDEVSSEDEDDLKDFIDEDMEDGGSEDDLPETIDAARNKKKTTKTPSSSGIPRRRAIVDDLEAPTRALSSALASGQISKEAWNEMIEIFGDGTDYLDMIIESGDEGEEDEDKEGSVQRKSNIERMAALELSVKDFPERLVQVGIVEVEEGNSEKLSDDNNDFLLLDDNFLQREAAFIAQKLQKLQVSDSVSGLTSAVLSVLRFIHRHGLEVPFIATYRKEYFLLFFGMNELWTILDEDVKYRQCSQLKQKISEKLTELENHLQAVDLTYVKEVALEQDLLDEAQLQFIQEFLIREKRHFKQATNSSKSKSELLIDFAHKIVPRAAHFAENIAKSRIIHGPLVLSEREMELEAVELVALDVAGTVDAVISGGISCLVEEFGTHPRLFGFVCDLLMNQAKLTVSPTPLGTIEISHDPTHYLTSLQFVTSKPISAFVEEQGLILARGLEGKLISISIDFDENELLEKLRVFLPGLEDFKEKVFDSAWKSYWQPRMNRLVMQRLRAEAETWTAHFTQFYLQDELMVAPLNLASRTREDDEIVASSVAVFGSTIHVAELDKFGRVLRQATIKVPPGRSAESFLVPVMNLRSEFVIVSGEGQECVDLYRDLRESRGLPKASVIWGSDDTARIYCESLRAAREFPECSKEMKFAVGVGRRMLNPVWEFAALSDDELLKLSLHSLQGSLPRALRLKHLHRALVNVINLLGVSVNELLLLGMREAMLKYVSGLGPQKASQLARNLSTKPLLSRSDLVTEWGLGKRTFTNCAGFIKITPERIRGGSGSSGGRKKSSVNSVLSSLIEPLDGTRIHPESYELARKMAADALELDDPSTLQRRQDIFGNDEDEEGSGNEDAELLSKAIVQVMLEPKKLDELLLEEYAKEIERLKHLPKNMTLFDIKAELQGPFPDPRAQQLQNGSILPSAPIHQIIKMLTGKEENWWYAGRSVRISPLNPLTRKYAALLDGKGLHVKIIDSEIPRSVRPGVNLNAFIERLDLERLAIDVTLRRPEDLDKITLQAVRFDPFYDFKRAAAATAANGSVKRTSGTFNTNSLSNDRSLRQLTHPAFKNVTREASEGLLASAPAGDFLIRPSSQKRLEGDLRGDLTLTWKCGPGLFVHVPLGESDRPKGQDWLLGRVLLLPGLLDRNRIDRFEDLDEILARRIEPCVSLLQEAQGCPKFYSNPSTDSINSHLRSQSASNPGRIPYCITLAVGANCGHLQLSHPGGRELICVDPRGYALRDPKTDETKIFERIDRLVDFFKRNYKNFSVANPPANTTTNANANTRDDPRNNKYQQFAN